MIDRNHLAALLSAPSERNDDLCELAAEARPPIWWLRGASAPEAEWQAALIPFERRAS